MQPHITIMFKQPLENFSKVRSAVGDYEHLFYETQNRVNDEVGFVEIFPDNSNPEINVESFEKAFDELKSGSIDYVALIANIAEDGEGLVGPAEFDIRLGENTWRLKNDSDTPDFSMDQFIASGLDEAQALAVMSSFSPKDSENNLVP